MFFDNEFHSPFTLFAFILILVNVIICDVTNSTTTKAVVDLKRLNATVHCKFQPNGYVCSTRKKSRQYYFDVRLKRCERFEYNSCNHSYNMFATRRLCLDKCRDDAYQPIPEILPAGIYCRFQPDFGDCNEYHPLWHYDITDRSCKGFSYSGCGGNLNRFSSAMQCEDICGSAIAITG